jgi:hypothetical protein
VLKNDIYEDLLKIGVQIQKNLVLYKNLIKYIIFCAKLLEFIKNSVLKRIILNDFKISVAKNVMKFLLKTNRFNIENLKKIQFKIELP